MEPYETERRRKRKFIFLGWFILSMIIVISMGTLASAIIIAIQRRGRLGQRLGPKVVRIAKFFGKLSFTDAPSHLRCSEVVHWHLLV